MLRRSRRLQFFVNMNAIGNTEKMIGYPLFLTKMIKTGCFYSHVVAKDYRKGEAVIVQSHGVQLW